VCGVWCVLELGWGWDGVVVVRTVLVRVG
jgi:hypothetical protein